MKRILLFGTGSLLLVSGITLILKDWTDIVVLFQGVRGMILALTGLIVLMFIKD